MDFTDPKRTILNWTQNDEPRPFDELLRDSREAMKAFRTLLISRLEVPITDHVFSMPQTTKAELWAICDVVNAIAETFGLFVECPKTGRPCKLGVSQPPVGRPSFGFNPQGNSTTKPYNPYRTVTLPTIHFVEAEPQMTKARADEGLGR